MVVRQRLEKHAFPKNRTDINSKVLILNLNCHYEKSRFTESQIINALQEQQQGRRFKTSLENYP